MKETKFKDTEVGLIPEDWKVVWLDDYFDFGNGFTPSKVNPVFWTNGTIPWFRMEDIRTNGHILKDSLQHVTPQAIKTSGLFPKYSIILSTTATIGEHALLIADSLANQQFTFLSRKVNRCNEVDIMYFYWHCYVLGDWCRKNINSGGLLAVNMDDLKQYLFPLPPINEQHRIASALTSMDNLISSLDKLIEKKKNIKQGAMQQLLTGKKRLKGFNEPWVEKPLKKICSFQNGYTPSMAINSFWDNGTIPWFRMEDIRTNGRILADSIQHITEDAVKGNLFPAKSIIISTTATIGEHALLIVDSLANQQFTNLTIRKSLTQAVDTMWFYHYCFVLGEWCRNNINEGGLAAVNMEDFSNVIIPLPSFNEQKSIASLLSSMDEEITSLEVKKSKYERIKQGMMQQLLTGKTRLTDAQHHAKEYPAPINDNYSFAAEP